MASPPTETTPVVQQCSTLGLDFPWMTSSPGTHLAEGIVTTPSPMCASGHLPVGYTSSPFGTPWYHDVAREDLLPATGPLMDLLQGREATSWGGRDSLGEFLDWSVASSSLRQQAGSPLPGMVPVSMYPGRGESGVIQREGLYPGCVESGVIQREGLYLLDDSVSHYKVDSSIPAESSRLSVASSGYHSSLSPSALSDSVDSPPPLVAEADEGYGHAGSPTDSHDFQQEVPTVDHVRVKMEGVKCPDAPPHSVQEGKVGVGHVMDTHTVMDQGHTHVDPVDTWTPAGAAHHQPTPAHIQPTPAHIQPTPAHHQPTTAPIKMESENPTPKTTMITPATVIKKVDPSAKPGVTYIELVARALLTSHNHKLILADIYAFILQNYPYYETAPKTWRNAVRHNLCVNDCFYKAERSNSGRGFFWAIHPACVHMFKQGDFRRTQARRLAQQMDNTTKMAASTVSQSTRGTTATPSPTPTHLSSSQGYQTTSQMVSGHPAGHHTTQMVSGSHQVMRMALQQPPPMYQVAPYTPGCGPSAYSRTPAPMVPGNHYQYYQLYNGSSTPATNSQSYYTTAMYN